MLHNIALHVLYGDCNLAASSGASRGPAASRAPSLGTERYPPLLSAMGCSWCRSVLASLATVDRALSDNGALERNAALPDAAALLQSVEQVRTVGTLRVLTVPSVGTQGT